MSGQETIFVHYPVFRCTDRWREMSAADRDAAAQEAACLLDAAAPNVTVRGVYSSVGFRPDADIAMWWVAATADALQDLLVAFRKTALGRALELSWTFMGLHRAAEFNPEHTPAFLRGEEPRRYLCVYPFVRTAEWYLLSPQERGRLLKEHGEIGHLYTTDVLTNTTQAFGLGDYEWVLAFETDHLDRLVDMIRALRAAEARRYTKLEVPFITGIRKDLAAVVADLA